LISVFNITFQVLALPLFRLKNIFKYQNYILKFATLFEKAVKELREFNIDIFRLNNGTYNYEFDVKEDFFEFFNFGLMETGKAKAYIQMIKSETLINMNIKVKGSVELTCDRSLEPFDFPLDTDNKILFKFGDRDEEVSDEIIIIDRNTQRLNVAQHIYDFISLAIPMKKIHPRFQEEEEDEDDETEVKLIYTSGTEEEINEEEEDVDPRWKILKNLKNNDN
jgi:uncharacterized protein